ncbi:hypothetical protein BKA70DRAFT_1374051 [Coprinopsis sp. MPI-PUGE-AT-0042]|nr:hypothetical protein BKA70DRAFT_1374051 [Coprinopsis sp. MPI-PUGE-AT-0042]
MLLSTAIAALLPGALCPNGPKPSFALKVAPGYEATAVVGKMSNPRGIALDARGNVLAVERGVGITGHFVDKNGCVMRSKLVVDDPSLNHGLDVNKAGNKLFATSREFAWSWDYNPLTMSATNRRTLVTGLATLKQLTRTIVASKVNPSFIFISISAGDGPDYESFDPAVGRAQIRAFDTKSLPPGGAAFNRCVTTTCGRYGLSNAVGVAEDQRGFVHAADNGAATIRVINGTGYYLGDDNPADPFFKLGSAVDPKGVFAGMPYCFPVWDPQTIEDSRFSLGQLPSTLPDTEKNDKWCAQNMERPEFLLPPHAAPLDFKFGVGKDTSLYASMHGNGFYDATKGFKVVSIAGKYDKEGWSPRDERINTTFTEILANDVAKIDGCLNGACFRPLGLAWSSDGQNLYVSSDNTGEVFLVKKIQIQRIGGQW